MAYRNGTYVAFDGLDTTSPVESDIKYFNLLKLWKSKSVEFEFSDSHKKNFQVRDTSLKETLKNRLLGRLRLSKNMILILTNSTRPDREILNYEVKKAIELGLPIIVCYPADLGPIYESKDLSDLWVYEPKDLSDYWVDALKEGIEHRTAQCIHIPFKQKPIFDAVSRFSLHKNKRIPPLSYYSKETYKSWGLV